MGRQMGRPAGRVEELRACGRPGVYGDAANEAILEQVGLEQALGLVLAILVHGPRDTPWSRRSGSVCRGARDGSGRPLGTAAVSTASVLHSTAQRAALA